MKLKNIFLGALVAATLASCSEQMDYKEFSIYDQAYMQKKFERAGGFLSTIYADLDSDFGNYSGAMLSSATDESVYSHDGNAIESFFNGSWSPTNANSSIWTTCYHGIAYCNLFLDEFTGLQFEDYSLDKNFQAEMYQYNNYQWEARFLRAYYYFLLVRQYGGVPLLTKNMNADEASKQPRVSADEVFAFIDSECEAIKDFITKDYGDLGNLAMTPANNGRANNLAVLALRARAALYHASPLFNPSNDKGLWQKAAELNKAVIDSCTARKMKLSNDYKGLFIGNTSWSDAQAVGEIIFGRRMPTENRNFETYNFPVGISGAGAGGGGGNCPSLNLVEAYEEGDKRFEQTVACNGDSWPNANTVPLETFVGGLNGLPLAYATPTGYYLKKYITESVQIAGNGANTCKHVWVTFRLAEFYLNYAEAMLNLTGSGYTAATGFTMTPKYAIDVVRRRAGLAGIEEGLSASDFKSKYEKERFVELAFEGHRFFDVRRWKEGEKYFKTIYGMRITKNADGTFSETKTVVQNRQWDDSKMNLFPIPQSEILKSGNVLEQNPGW
ncbi:MAG: RagB/SusD family nutrient uptake outer membrane protein [Prevotella sp.]|nr:RagB/SusD family nutrient uptake outer membrane protein [Prevotella sp.]MBP5508167.1 RagB/SusD family nutrient uptake outer membrane protein [Prevotella sp.]